LNRGSQQWASVLSRAQFFLIDYGLPRAQYYHPQRTDGTLRCHFKHRGTMIR